MKDVVRYRVCDRDVRGWVMRGCGSYHGLSFGVGEGLTTTKKHGSRGRLGGGDRGCVNVNNKVCQRVF